MKSGSERSVNPGSLEMRAVAQRRGAEGEEIGSRTQTEMGRRETERQGFLETRRQVVGARKSWRQRQRDRQPPRPP